MVSEGGAGARVMVWCDAMRRRGSNSFKERGVGEGDSNGQQLIISTVRPNGNAQTMVLGSWGRW